MRHRRVLALALGLALLAGLLPFRALAQEEASDEPSAQTALPDGMAAEADLAFERGDGAESSSDEPLSDEILSEWPAPEDLSPDSDGGEASEEPEEEPETPGEDYETQEAETQEAEAGPAADGDELDVQSATLEASLGDLTLSADLRLGADAQYDTITVQGAVTLDLNGFALRADKGVVVAAGATLTLRDGSAAGTGTLTATGADGAAGIGGVSGGSVGTILIEGGTVAATGGDGGAGIGGGSGRVTAGGDDTGTITIRGGTVTATGGDGGAGIGSGRGGADSGAYYITVEGGAVIAAGGQTAAGAVNAIGRGSGSTAAGSVTISGGTVTAADICADWSFSTGESGHAFVRLSSTTLNTSGSASWSGVIFRNDSGAVYGGDITLTTDAAIPSGILLTIDSGRSLSLGAGVTLTNAGTIRVNGALWVSSGAVENTGRIYIDGSLGGASQISGSGAVGYRVSYTASYPAGSTLIDGKPVAALSGTWYQRAGQTFSAYFTTSSGYGPILLSVQDVYGGTALDYSWTYAAQYTASASTTATVSFTMPEGTVALSLEVRELVGVKSMPLTYFAGDSVEVDLNACLQLDSPLTASDVSVTHHAGSLSRGLSMTLDDQERRISGIFGGSVSSTGSDRMVFLVRDNTGQYAPNLFAVTFTSKEPSYLVTIPATISLDFEGENTTFEVKAEEVLMGEGNFVRVAISRSANGFKLETAEGKSLSYVLNYTNQKGETRAVLSAESTTLLKVWIDKRDPSNARGGIPGSESVWLSFQPPASASWHYAGQYTDTLTFTIFRAQGYPS